MYNYYKWLSKHFETSEDYIKQIMANENATSYLFIWPIFEQEYFSGFMKKNEINNAISKIESINIDDFENVIIHFHNRYQNTVKYKNLKHNEIFVPVDNIINKKYEDLCKNEKLMLLFYVIYRYRNNIFHGNKGILSWSKYKIEINFCIYAMTKLIDVRKIINDKHF